MTVIRPNSISGITSITAQANEINVFRSNGLIAGLNLNGVNFNTTAGISTLAALKVTGNLDVEGVLTYQDVTNVDSLGIGTFRTGINVSGGQLDVGSNIKLGNAGVITATSFVGSGAQLTGLPAGTTINSNTNNYLITGTGTANTLQGESTLTYDNPTLEINTDSSPYGVLNLNGNSGGLVQFEDNEVTKWSLFGDSTFSIYDNTGSANRLRITSSGSVMINKTSSFGSVPLQVKGASSGLSDGGQIFDIGTAEGSSGTRLALGVSEDNFGWIRSYESGVGGRDIVFAASDEKMRLTTAGQLFINSTAVVNTNDFLTIKRPAGGHSMTSMTLDATTATGSYANALIFTKSKDYFFNGLVFTSSTGHQGGIAAKMTTNGGSTPEIQMRIGGSAFNQSDTLAMSVHNTGTVQSYYHATSRNGIVQVQQVTSETRYSGSIASVDLITGSTFTPKTSAPRFLIMIFCPVNTSDDSDAGNGNRNDYFYGRIEYRKNGGSWLECNNQGSTAQQGGYAAHVELSPNRTGPNSTDYWSGNRYRTESKTATILVTNVGDCGSSGNVQFKLRCYSYTGNFIQIGQPHGYGTDDNYGVQPWGFTVFELAPDSNSYTAY